MIVSSNNQDYPIIQVCNISKQYQIGSIDRTSFRTEVAEFLNSVGKKTQTKFFGHAHPETEKQYFWALKDVSFEVRRGEVLGIIGENGSGKSTLLKILSRITKPTAGHIVMDDRLVSMLEVGTGFHPELTGRENVYLSGTIIGMEKAEIDQRYDDIVDFSGIAEFMDTPVKRYSSGMYVRLAFSVSTQLVSEIILIDEVLAVGDAEFQRKSLAKIDELRQRGKTIILVSHNLYSIEQLCDRVMWLDAGRVKKIDTCHTVTDDYLNQDDTPIGTVEFNEESGSNGARLIKVYTSCDGLALSEIPYGKEFAINIEYEVDRVLEGLRVGCRVWNRMNAPILHTSTVDIDKESQSLLGKPGKKNISVQIPQSWLASEEYYLEIGIWSPDVKHHHHVIKALSFKIVSEAAETGIAEEFRPHLNWSILSQ